MEKQTEVPLVSKLQTQTIHTMTTSTNNFIYDTNGVSTITITGYEGSASEFVIPDVIDGYTVTKIAESVFNGNTQLNTVVLPSGLTSIESSTFYGCTNLKTIEIPDIVKEIGSVAFYNCTNLKNIYFSCNAPAIADKAFNSVTATAYYQENNYCKVVKK